MKVIRMWTWYTSFVPALRSIGRCHFCGKRIKVLSKYVQLDSDYKYTYLGHVDCVFLHMITHPMEQKSDYFWVKWGAPHPDYFK